MDEELARQVALAKAAVREARTRAIAHVQAAQSQMEYDVTSLQAESLERLQDQMHSRTLDAVWAGWAGVAARKQRALRLLTKGLARRDDRNLRRYFGGWLTARRALVNERTQELRQEVEERELQLRRIQDGASPMRSTSTSLDVSSRLARQSDAAIGAHMATLESQLRRAERETTAIELQSTIAQETIRDRQRVLAANRSAKNAAESELATYQTELNESLLAASDATPVENDAEIAELRLVVRQQELQIADAMRTRAQAENTKEEGLERLEDELNRQVRLRESASLHQESLRQRLAEHEGELSEHRSAIQAADKSGANANTEKLRSDLRKEKAMRQANERQVQEQERAVAAKEQELAAANDAAEAAIQELHSSTAKIKSSMQDQMLEQTGSAKAVELRTNATRRQVEAHEEDLMQAQAAIRHAEEELILQRDSHDLRIQAEDNATAEAKRQYDELRTKLHAVQGSLRNTRKHMSRREHDASAECDTLAAQLAEQEAAAERTAMQVATIAKQIDDRQAELNATTAEMQDIAKQVHTERLAIEDSVGQQLLQESLGAQSLKLIHDSALRTFAAVEDRLNEAKMEAEKMNAKSDAQRLQLTRLVREAQVARQEAEQEHQAAAVKQTNLKAEIDETRSVVHRLEEALHAKQAELGDRRRKTASASTVDETKLAEQTRLVAAQEAKLARLKAELSNSVTETHGIRDAHGGQVHEAAMARRLAVQEVELLRQHLEKLVNTTPKLRAQCLVAETECRKMQVKLARMRARADSPTLAAERQHFASATTSFASSSAADVDFEDYAHRRSPPPRSPTQSPTRTGSKQSDAPLLMDIDALIRQVAQEHTRSVVSSYSSTSASRNSPTLQFSPPRSPTIARPKPVLRQPDLSSQAAMASKTVPNRRSPPRTSSAGTSVGFAPGTKSGQPATRIVRQQTGFSGHIPLQPEPEPEPVDDVSAAAGYPPRKGAGSSGSVPLRRPTPAAAGELGIPPRGSGLEPSAIGMSPRSNPANAHRATIAPRERPAEAAASTIPPRQPPVWSRQLEHQQMSPSVTAGGSGGGGSMQEVHALRAPRLEVDLGGVSLEHGGSAQDRATNGNGRISMELDPNATSTSAFTSIQTAQPTAVDVGGPPANPEAPSPPQQLQPQQPDVEIDFEVSEDEADGFGTHPWIYSCLPSYRAAEPHAQATAQGSTTYIQRLN
jgi:hypothetical protein